ncbi:YeeE/YedE family protein [Bosea vaviloviae]|uniref:YeeE/YedE family protein n=1 Tax=Bosea vaviloviae TaxID=1526658 RepID=UPI0006BA8A02|nr:YeeE/YedE family protein [Bosea vaviloviae]
MVSADTAFDAGSTGRSSSNEVPVRSVQPGVVIVAAIAIAAVAALSIDHATSWRLPVLALVGGGLGFVLFQATFGFAGSFRAALERRDFSGFRAQAIALALTSCVFFPLLAGGQLFGLPLSGFVTPIGVSFVVGAILFGVGMQIGGGCASGTLFGLGGGNARLLMTLAFFVLGSAVGAAHLGFWWALPAFQTGTSQDVLGWPLALAIHLMIFMAIIRLVPASRTDARALSWRSLFREPWPLAWGAIGLALLNILTMALVGRPWGETAGFTLWGSKLAAVVGFDPASWPYWQGNAGPLATSVFADATSVMDFAMIAGSAAAAGLSGRFAARSGGSGRAWLGAAVGGFLMGYGARLSDGCNIGAYFSALASGSLSGWVWIAAAFLGSALGLKLRGAFHLDR